MPEIPPPQTEIRSATTAHMSCRPDPLQEPVAIVIFGATGDLTSRKLFPALFSLFAGEVLPQRLAIIGVGRSSWSDAAFREHMHNQVAGNASYSAAAWETLAPRLRYIQQEYTGDYGPLAQRLEEIDAELGLEGNRLFYLAVPPTVYIPIADGLGASGLAAEDHGWSRFVVEKPFGRDLASAESLDASLHTHFAEHQIFRIDHYLAKETVQNILMLRFANTIFEPVWNRRYVDSVQILAAESIGVGHRAGYYDSFGVLRDMFQNHMMQLLSLCAMEPPSHFEADRVRDEKTKIYRSLRPFHPQRVQSDLVLGQYAAGEIEGAAVPAYRTERGVAKDSQTPTFAAMRLYIDNWRWQGVPFYLVSGKRLAAKRTEIRIQFKHVPYSLFRGVLSEDIAANSLVLGIQPREEVSLEFQTKSPGAKMCLRPVQMHFDYHHGTAGPVLEAYEKVLLDCLLGDQTLFWRQDGVELCWGFLDPILQGCENDPGKQPHLYTAGSWGPEAAEGFLPPWEKR